MGLTDDMTRLCGEIVALRQLRRAFVQDLVQNVARLKTSFRQAHTQMSKETREKLTGAVFDLKTSVAGLRQENLLDLAGARRAWLGKLSPDRGRAEKTPPAPPRPPRPTEPAQSREAPAAATRPVSPAPKKAPPKKPSAKKGKPGGSPAAGKGLPSQGSHRKKG